MRARKYVLKEKKKSSDVIEELYDDLNFEEFWKPQ